MKLKELKNLLHQSLEDFLNSDKNLLLDVHEQSISHRIAVYIEKNLGETDLNIDCEYNRYLKEPKRISCNIWNIRDIDLKKCNCSKCSYILKNRSSIDELINKGIRPDIVVHERGSDSRNELVIEIKKDKICPFDIEKLKALTSNKSDGGFDYKWGVFIYFFKNKPICLFLKKGKALY